MLCFQCEQAARCKVHVGEAGICGKKAETAKLQENLLSSLIGLARATEGNEHLLRDSTADMVVDGLAALFSGVDLDYEILLERADQEKRKLVPDCYLCAAPCGRTENYDMDRLWNMDADVRYLKSSILSGSRDIAENARQAAALGYRDDTVHSFLYKALFAIGMDDWGVEELQVIVREMNEAALRCKTMLDKANHTPE